MRGRIDTVHTQRLEAVMNVATAAGAGAALVSDRASLHWLGADGARHLLVRGDAAVVIAADGASPPPATARAPIERFDATEREAVAAALARALVRVELPPYAPVAIEPAQLPSALLRVLGSDACRDIGGAIAGMRARKDADELVAIARSARLVDAGQRALREHVAEGRSELALWSRAHAAVVAAAHGEVRTRVELMAGARTELSGRPPGREAVAAGEPVLLALACERDGYWAASTTTVCCGAPDAHLRHRHDAVRRALELGVAAARPGATSGDVDDAIRTRLTRDGLHFPHPTGYAIGRSPQEAPRLLPGGSARLAPGMVLVLEAGAARGGAGVRLAQTVVVASGGAQPLTSPTPALA